MSKKKYQVVYNACFGGFSLSKEAMEMLAKLGWNDAQKELDEHAEWNKDKKFTLDDFHVSEKQLPRHDQRLIQVVKALGDKAGGQFSELRIAKIEGNKYRIEEYDGSESVVEPGDTVWTVIE